MLPYGRQQILEEDIQAVVETLHSDWLTTGPAVERFEKALAELAQVQRVVTATSGTAALHMAYAGAGVGRGDQVVTTPMTFVATASTALQLGAEIVFADVDPATANIDPAAVEAAVTDRTKVIAGVDYAGRPIDADALNAIAAPIGALTLEDAAHSIGATYKGRPVGSLTDLTTFSFFPTKNMTSAEGGAVAAKDPEVAQRIHEFHFIGLVRDRARMRYPDEGPWHQEVHQLGLNYRLPDVLSALGLSQLGRLQAFKQRRAEIFERYQSALADVPGIECPAAPVDVDPTWHLYPVRIKDGRRRGVFEAMRAAGIGVQVNYIPVYWHPLFEDLGYKRGMCPNAEAFYAEELSLPMFVDLSESDQDRVVEELIRILGD